ncbi:MAG TPA: hypothetical protein VEP90_27740 [Methylomirabilota bacterium]|nr:hypothetical protein [Methylomirabilota bacterium]
MKKRYKSYNWESLVNATYERAFVIEDLLAPVRLLRNIDKPYSFELVEDYKKYYDLEFP